MITLKPSTQKEARYGPRVWLILSMYIVTSVLVACAPEKTATPSISEPVNTLSPAETISANGSPIPESTPPFNDQFWTIYTTKDGLANNWVRLVEVGADGALWFASDKHGVYRFDGKEWVTYTVDDGLADNRVSVIAAAPDHSIWVGTEKGASYFDGRSWATYTTDNGLTNNYVTSIAVEAGGGVWFGTNGGGVSRFDGKNWVTYTTANGLSDNRVWAVFASQDGALWAGTSQGYISRFYHGQWDIYPTNSNRDDNIVYSIASTPDGVLWFGSLGAVTRFNGHSWAIYEISGDAQVPVRCLAPVSDGTLWFPVVMGGGVFHITRPPDKNMMDLWGENEGWEHFAKRDGLIDNWVISIAIGPDGSVWFGTNGYGISRFDGVNWISYRADDLPSRRIWDIAVALDGSVWFATGGGIYRYMLSTP
jgi:ligand-binding sensor domain-containing protein